MRYLKDSWDEARDVLSIARLNKPRRALGPIPVSRGLLPTACRGFANRPLESYFDKSWTLLDMPDTQTNRAIVRT